jgi:hypothetical protein
MRGVPPALHVHDVIRLESSDSDVEDGVGGGGACEAGREGQAGALWLASPVHARVARDGDARAAACSEVLHTALHCVRYGIWET